METGKNRLKSRLPVSINRTPGMPGETRHIISMMQIMVRLLQFTESKHWTMCELEEMEMLLGRADGMVIDLLGSKPSP